jgi:hypothetical protein
MLSWVMVVMASLSWFGINLSSPGLSCYGNVFMLGMSVLSQLVIILMINEVCTQKHIFSFAINPTLKLVNVKRVKYSLANAMKQMIPKKVRHLHKTQLKCYTNLVKNVNCASN